MAKSKTPKKAKQNEVQNTTKSILKKNKAEEVEVPEVAEVETPKPGRKGRPKRNQAVTPVEKINKKSSDEIINNPESPTPIAKKEKIVFDMPCEENDVVNEEEMMELAVQFPRLTCYKSALLHLLDTDKPVILKEPLNLVIQYQDRYEAIEAMERLKGVTDESKHVTAKLRHLGQAVPEKRVVYVPKKAPVEEAITVLKKVYGAHMVEAKAFANESKMMLLSFGSEEAARAADKIKNKSYHGMELKIGSFFAQKKRGLEEEESKQSEPKKMKKEETNGDSEMKEEKEDDEKEENEEGDEEVVEANEEETEANESEEVADENDAEEVEEDEEQEEDEEEEEEEE